MFAKKRCYPTIPAVSIAARVQTILDAHDVGASKDENSEVADPVTPSGPSPTLSGASVESGTGDGKDMP
ncbi:hypothetical protein LTS15_002753 [Exophiala xenobiotica]|nr:hypothetical protein LTS15_002753 [Exophiala xenobiotica]